MKSWSKIALIPAYNPEYCLVDLVQTLKKKGFWILVVDDGSSEEHKIIFRDINDVGNVLILTHIKNEGKGSALKTGLSYIQTNISDYCIVVTVDADGQHSPSDVEKICWEAEKYKKKHRLKVNLEIGSPVLSMGLLQGFIFMIHRQGYGLLITQFFRIYLKFRENDMNMK